MFKLSFISQISDLPRSAVTWCERDKAQINNYRDLCNIYLKGVDFPQELASCCHRSCALPEHKLILDKLYQTIVNILSEAAVSTQVIKPRKCRQNKLYGWNRQVREARLEARLRFKSWLFNNRPSSGAVYEQMCLSRKVFKSRLKLAQNNQEQIKMDLIAEQRDNKNFV
ncbi:unnamed protein product [Pieris macdunnoughi]|uniref:Uncharacterized protein n=1 Tax=Pieris macdunnoughi TaxID=345717 RepID=A0A821VTA5_9NEOP|nr:unnamed protein product [Pieris macdunnoughi]